MIKLTSWHLFHSFHGVNQRENLNLVILHVIREIRKGLIWKGVAVPDPKGAVDNIYTGISQDNYPLNNVLICLFDI